MADERVREVQQWLNNTFPAYFRYDEDPNNCGSYPIKPDGLTGTKTVKALVMALQIHYNLTPVDGIWGNATSAVCPDIKAGVTNSVLIRIAQGGFYCKGYEPGGFDGIFGNNLANAIANFKSDLGILPSNVMEPNVFKALLTMDPSKLVIFDGDIMVREVQKYLNGNYYNLFKSKLGYIPTGGIYERKTSKALIYAFQKEIGTTADGALGPNTFNMMPTLESGSNNTALITILQAALICNGYGVTSLNGIYDYDLEQKVRAFQEFMCLDTDPLVNVGKVNRRTWGALLWSKGDTSRKPNAGDCWQKLSLTKAQSLYDDGYRFIGRYLTKVPGGLDKDLTKSEITDILSAGLMIFPIFQETNNAIEDFSFVSGYEDGYDAIMAATELAIPPGTTIYFAVDFDALEEEAEDEISEYFRGISKAKEDVGSTYEIGIYSARNTCSIICDKDLATSSFVSDMSSGYSGNLGYNIPDNWAYDQYNTISYTASDNTSFDLDQVIASNNAEYFSCGEIVENDYWDNHKYCIGLNALQTYSSNAVNIHSIIPLIKQLEDIYWLYKPNDPYMNCIVSVLYYLWKAKYGNDIFFTIPLETANGFVSYVNNNYATLAAEIKNYTEETQTGEDQTINYTYVKDSDVINETDANNVNYNFCRVFELPHLAVTLSAYLDLDLTRIIKREWFGWAGDLATGVKEVGIVATNYPNTTVIEHARDRIGKMEVLANNSYNLPPTYEVQMNYCDFFADMDAIGIAALVKRHLQQDREQKNALSDAFTSYYLVSYKKRCSYLLNEIKPSEYSIDGITEALVDYFNAGEQTTLVVSKMGQVSSEVLEASCRSFAEFVMHDRMSYV